MNESPNALRLVFMGTAELAGVILRALATRPDLAVAAVVTQPDRPKGRRLKLQPSPVKTVALEFGLPVLQPEKARDPAFLKELESLAPDLGVVAAYGQILPPAVLETPRLCCLNVHTSLLPKYRGAAPIQWAILNDEPETGVTIMKMDAGLDTGPILAQRKTIIEPGDDAVSLHDRLARLGADLLIDTIPGYVSGNLPPRPQPEASSSYARKIKKEDGHLDWSEPARVLWNRVRALVPWPGAFTHLPVDAGNALLKIWLAEVADRPGGDQPGRILSSTARGIVVGCGQGSLNILELQREGGRRMSPRAFLAGHALREGDVLPSEIIPDSAR